MPFPEGKFRPFSEQRTAYTMRTFFILFLKEFKTYFLTPFGWVVIGLVLLMQGLSTTGAIELMKKGPTIDNFLLISFRIPHFWYYFLFIFPLITMRLFAEEEKSGTLEPLMTAPVTTIQVVCSKYFAAFCFYTILWLPILFQLKIFQVITGTPAPVEMGHVLGTYLILLLMGAFFLSIGCLASTLTSSQIIAGIITIAALVFFYFLGFVPYIVTGNFKAVSLFHYVSVTEHLDNFARGLVDTGPIVYYLSMAAFMLFLTHLVLDFRRWKS